ncbi:collagen-like surface protein [Streptococcus pyogenes]|nr:collagen-like surface protein [Streptococcus pyogenes]
MKQKNINKLVCRYGLTTAAAILATFGGGGGGSERQG